MWIFVPGGLLMPAAIPTPGPDKPGADPRFTRNGVLNLQVRARVESHLTNFIRDYMPEDTYSDIEATPNMDYNFRFYTTREIFAQALSRAVMDIDYTKFKPTAERRGPNNVLLYKDGKQYHDVLNAIWGSVTRLGRPGGMWGAYSGTNPRGYRPAATASRHTVRNDRRIGDSFRAAEYDTMPMFMDGLDDEFEDEGFDGYIPDDERARELIRAGLRDIPIDQWEEYLDETDLELMREEIQARRDGYTVAHEEFDEIMNLRPERSSKRRRGRGKHVARRGSRRGQ